MDSATFNAAYWASKAPEVVKAFDVNGAGQDEAAREAAAPDLVRRGLIIDREIMIWGQDPFKIMSLRVFYGFTWVPNAVQPAPWASVGGAPYDPKLFPPGCIRVSVDPADYPPFAPPPPPPPPAHPSYIGDKIFGDFYASLPGNPAKPGDIGVKNGVEYVLGENPFGSWWVIKKA